jgi:hypothetical protein
MHVYAKSEDEIGRKVRKKKRRKNELQGSRGGGNWHYGRGRNKKPRTEEGLNFTLVKFINQRLILRKPALLIQTLARRIKLLTLLTCILKMTLSNAVGTLSAPTIVCWDSFSLSIQITGLYLNVGHDTFPSHRMRFVIIPVFEASSLELLIA